MTRTLRGTFLSLVLVIAAGAHALTVTLTPHHEFCGNASGWIDCTVSGGVPPYTFAWSNADTSEDVYALVAGIYSVTVTDFVGTQVIEQTTVNSLTAYPPAAFLGQRAYCLSGGGAATAHSVVELVGLQEQYFNLGYPLPQQPLMFNGVVAEEFLEVSGFPSYLIMASAMPGVTYQVSFTDNSGCPGAIDLRNGWEVEWPTMSVLDVQGACSSGNNGVIQLALTAEGHQQFTDLELRRADHSLVERQGAGNQAGVQQFSALVPGDYWVVQRILSLGNSTLGAQIRAFCGDSIFVTVPDLGAACGNVNGTVYMDYNVDCVMGSAGSETRVPCAILEFQPGPVYATANASGAYSINLASGAYTLQQIAADIAQHCPAPPAPVNVVGVQTLNIADTALVPMDAEVMIANGPARPGFELHYVIQQTNLTPASTGNTSTVFTFDPAVTYVSASPAPSNVNGNVLTWNQNAMGAFGIRTIQVQLQVPPDVGLIGTVLNASVSLTTINTDAVAANNSASTILTVTASYDPNDKVALTSSQWSNDLYYIDVDDWVDYTVRFQNTGTDTAFTVIITDTLPSTLDPASVQWGANSHACMRSLTSQGILKFIFPNILLPDSNVNEAASHGFASFRIKLRTPVLPGTIIENVANIFFDFNPPVITEPSVLVAEFSTGVIDVQQARMQLYPNPANDRVRVNWPQGTPLNSSWSLVAPDGRVVLSGRTTAQDENLDIRSAATGAYVLRLETNTAISSVTLLRSTHP
ncbi:MAG: T9SS type A sorting domain-containing protein [Flavobacteriales bacterium]|nr:T9SS type A sorting domain-containing protein [Flavobacteriales bacterium]